MCVAAASAQAGGAGTVRLQATYTSVQYGWSQVERWQDTYASWPAQQYPGDSRDDQTGQRLTFFGSAEPPGSEFLLYYAPGWNTGTHAVPVLLVMGANDTVDREYADPSLGGSGTCGALSCPTTGLMQYLSGKGYKVFAINFANPQGDNYQWAQSIAALLSRDHPAARIHPRHIRTSTVLPIAGGRFWISAPASWSKRLRPCESVSA